MTVFNDSIYLVSEEGTLYRTAVSSSIGSNAIDSVPTNRLITTTTSEPVEGIRDLTVFNGKLHFTGIATGTGREIFEYQNGVTLVVPEVRTGTANFDTEFLTVVNGSLLFREVGADRWWRYSGSTTPRILPGTNYRNMTDYEVYNNKLYFSAQTDITQGGFTRTEYQLFETNGTSAPTVVSGFGFIFNVSHLGVFKNQLVFDGQEFNFSGFSDSFLGFYNGTSFSKVDQNGYFGGTNFTENNDTLYFSAGGTGNDFELWRYVDGGLPEKVTDINPTGNSVPGNLFSFNNNLFFAANDGTNGRELWGIGPDFKDGITSIFDFHEEDLNLLIYPNPASSVINTEEGALEIFDALGNEVLSTESTGQVDVSNLSSGIYFVSQKEQRTKLVIE